jgi:hypothetical protein
MTLQVPVLVIRGRDDVISTPQWELRLAGLAAEGGYREVPSLTRSLVGGGHLLFTDRDPGPPTTATVNKLVTTVGRIRPGQRHHALIELKLLRILASKPPSSLADFPPSGFAAKKARTV